MGGSAFGIPTVTTETPMVYSLLRDVALEIWAFIQKPSGLMIPDQCTPFFRMPAMTADLDPRICVNAALVLLRVLSNNSGK